MRGKRIGMAVDAIGNRIIPAHAGQTRCERCRRYGRADHPRACGANSALRPSNILQSGSSPRMRGKPRLCTAAISVLRIIPAHAGQTCGGRRGPACSADHPRACGANIGVDVSDAFGCGSSPRMRGKRWSRRPRCHSPRIIPAHAGQTPVRPPAAIRPSDHPRACGANSAVDRADQMNNGSSPRMRGKQRHQTGNTGTVRIIPAHAGQTMFHCS